MKLAAVLIVALLLSGCAMRQPPKPAYRLAITLDVEARTLSWVNTKDHTRRHLVDYRTFLMHSNEQVKPFDPAELEQMGPVLAILIRYILESERWYDDPGPGDRPPIPRMTAIAFQPPAAEP